MQKLIVGITGSSGVVYGIRLLELLKHQPAFAAPAVRRSRTDYRVWGSFGSSGRGSRHGGAPG